MKHVDEYRGPDEVRRCAESIARRVTRPWRIMEVCGGQTNTILRNGLDQLLPSQIEIVHGPGCPVCVTPVGVLDAAQELSRRPEVILCTFADMLRVPSTHGDLALARAEGADVRTVYSPMEALQLAEAFPNREVVFLAVGFETTAPANALVAREALRRGIENFSLLLSHVLVPPALRAILASPDCRVQAFLAAGHVCAVMGFEEYENLARSHGVPIVVTGFEPLDILHGVRLCVEQLETGRSEVENQYARAVRRSGNVPARELLREVFEVVPQRWRGLGELAESGLGLRGPYAGLDATRRFARRVAASSEDSRCRAGLVLQGKIKPDQCPEFGRSCTPENPLGAPMVSDEGACAAYHRYDRPSRAVG